MSRALRVLPSLLALAHGVAPVAEFVLPALPPALPSASVAPGLPSAGVAASPTDSSAQLAPQLRGQRLGVSAQGAWKTAGEVQLTDVSGTTPSSLNSWSIGSRSTVSPQRHPALADGEASLAEGWMASSAMLLFAAMAGGLAGTWWHRRAQTLRGSGAASASEMSVASSLPWPEQPKFVVAAAVGETTSSAFAGNSLPEAILFRPTSSESHASQCHAAADEAHLAPPFVAGGAPQTPRTLASREVVARSGRSIYGGVQRGNKPGGPNFNPAQFGGGKKKKTEEGDKSKKNEPDHPKIYKDSPIIYNGKKVGKLNGTISEYKVDIWSGAHPVWQGKKGKVMLDAGASVKFQEKYGAFSDIFGDTGMEQLEKNRQLKEEIEKRRADGLKTY